MSPAKQGAGSGRARPCPRPGRAASGREVFMSRLVCGGLSQRQEQTEAQIRNAPLGEGEQEGGRVLRVSETWPSSNGKEAP